MIVTLTIRDWICDNCIKVTFIGISRVIVCTLHHSITYRHWFQQSTVNNNLKKVTSRTLHQSTGSTIHNKLQVETRTQFLIFFRMHFQSFNFQDCFHLPFQIPAIVLRYVNHNTFDKAVCTFSKSFVIGKKIIYIYIYSSTVISCPASGNNDNNGIQNHPRVTLRLSAQ